MSKDWYKDLQDFHREVMLDKFPTIPTVPDWRYYKLRKKLIREEVNETLEALKKGNLAQLADGIADSIYVLIGTAVTYGIDMRPIWKLTQEANMKKREGKMRPDGKRLKPEDWKHPDIEAEIRRQQNAKDS